MSAPKIILGTMTYGGQTCKADVASILKDFSTNYPTLVGPVPEIDTARMYCSGATETLLGEIIARDPSLQNVSIASKANPFFKESLSAEGLAGQLGLTLKALQVEQVWGLRDEEVE
jgi:aryl-alcohol dehydrogenase-like predicted oxidoreductase